MTRTRDFLRKQKSCTKKNYMKRLTRKSTKRMTKITSVMKPNTRNSRLYKPMKTQLWSETKTMKTQTSSSLLLRVSRNRQP
jgi:hypothetical protein